VQIQRALQLLRGVRFHRVQVPPALSMEDRGRGFMSQIRRFEPQAD